MKITGIGENNLNSFRGFIESLLPDEGMIKMEKRIISAYRS